MSHRYSGAVKALLRRCSGYFKALLSDLETDLLLLMLYQGSIKAIFRCY
jgi:hypothetical protein